MSAERTHDKMRAGCRGRWVGAAPMLSYDLSDRGDRLTVKEDSVCRNSTHAIRG